MMDGEKLADRKIGSVKAAVSSYGERIGKGNQTIKTFQANYTEESKPFTKTRELHEAKRDTNQLKESIELAESVTSEAKSELSEAKKRLRDLTLRIQESNARAKAQMGELEKLKMGNSKEAELDTANSECAKVMRELEWIKRDLSKLKLDMASVMEERRRAEKEMNESLVKRLTHLSLLDALDKEIEEINEEHVLVELARIEAIKEYEEIEAQRKEMGAMYSATILEARKKRENMNMIDEIEGAEDLETKLAIVNLDIDITQSELKRGKEEDKSGSALLLETVMKELEARKKELDIVKEEGFQFMASMDVVRNELKHVVEQTSRLKKKEAKSEMAIQSLNSKLLRAKVKLEAASEAEDKAKTIVSNLSQTFEQVKSEAETHEMERSLTSEETATLQAEVERAETEIDLAEEKLQAVLQDLKAAKSSEAIALENLKALIEKTVRNRASASRPSATITISKFEYEYLRGNAAEAKEIADKKVEAAQAWVEALKASEREIQIKSELLRRETRELRVGEEHKVDQTEGSTNAKKIIDDDFEEWRQMMEPDRLKPDVARMTKSNRRTPQRRGRQRSASPMVHGTPQSTSFTVRRKRKVMPNLAKFFSGKSIEGNL